jgi:hypothetical protein
MNKNAWNARSVAILVHLILRYLGNNVYHLATQFMVVPVVLSITSKKNITAILV